MTRRRRTLTRREFAARVGAVVGGLAASTVPAALRAQSAPGTGYTQRGRSLERIGVQLYSVRRAMQQGVEATLAQVAAIGYKEVEFAGYFNKTPREIRAILDANGLTAPSAHNADLNAIRTRFPQVLEESAVVGHLYVVCASLPRSEHTPDGFRRAAESFNRAGEQAQAAGLTFGYHNHDFEFAKLADGSIGYDLLLAGTDPKLVKMQADLFWMVKGGVDPLAYFAKHPGRFYSVHVKDMDAAGTMTEVGGGQLPFAKFFAQSEQAGLRHYFVEHDNPADPMASIAASFRHLKALTFS